MQPVTYHNSLTGWYCLGLLASEISLLLGWSPVSYLIDVWLFFELLQGLQEVAPPNLRSTEPPVPIPIHHVENPTNHLREHNNNQCPLQ